MNSPTTLSKPRSGETPIQAPKPYWSEDQYKAMSKRTFVAMCAAPEYSIAYPAEAAELRMQIERKLRGAPPALKVYKNPVGPRKPLFDMHRVCPLFVPRAFKITGEDCMKITCRHFGVRKNDLIGERRFKEIIFPRHVCMWLMRQHTTLSMPVIGKLMGNRDHTTVLNSVRNIEAHLAALENANEPSPEWARDGFMEAAE